MRWKMEKCSKEIIFLFDVEKNVFRVWKAISANKHVKENKYLFYIKKENCETSRLQSDLCVQL